MTDKNNYELDPDPETAAELVKPKLDEISPTMCLAKWLWTSVHLHSGHIEYFKAAKQLGDKLVVVLNSDEWLIRKNRGIT
jgi:hypothetical protein